MKFGKQLQAIEIYQHPKIRESKYSATREQLNHLSWCCAITKTLQYPYKVNERKFVHILWLSLDNETHMQETAKCQPYLIRIKTSLFILSKFSLI